MSESPPPADPTPDKGDAPAGGPAPARPVSKRPSDMRPWQGGRFRSKDGGSSSRWRTILILIGLMLALAGAIVGWATWPHAPPQPHFASFVIDQYSDPDIPVMPWADQDRKALAARGWQAPNTANDQERRLFLEHFSRLGSDQPADEPLVIYLRAYAVPTANGDLAVLPADARLDDESSWAPLREVFRLLKACPVQKRLLVLDVMQPFASARAGVLVGDAAARASAVLDDALKDDPNLMVLCACSPGQNSLASEEMGHTVFVHYLIDGLSGKADGWGADGGKDNRVWVREVAAYTAVNVDRWAWHNRACHQTPVLRGGGDADFALAVADSGPAPADAALEPAYPNNLKAAWELRDRWLADARVRTPPELFRRLEGSSRRAEDRWQAGAAADTLAADLKNETEGLESRRNALVRAAGRGTAPSLAMAVAQGTKPPAKPDDAVDALNRLADLHSRPGPEAAAQLDPKAKAFQKDYENKLFELSWLVFRAAVEHPSTPPAELRFWLSLLHPEGKPGPDSTEIHFLEALADLPAKDAGEWPPETIGAALGLAQAAAEADAAWELCPPVADALTDYVEAWRREADGRRQAAEALLFKSKAADRRTAQKSLEAARSGDRGYEGLRGAVSGLRDAIRTCDEAERLLAGFLVYGEPAPGRESDWKKAVEQAEAAAKLTRTLRDRLDKAEGLSPDWFVVTEARRKTLQDSMDALPMAALSRRVPSLIAQSSQAQGADAEDMRLTLRLPALSAPDRDKLWAGWRQTTGRLNDESAATAVAPEAAPPAPDADDRKLAELAVYRARAALALLTLDGAGDLTKLQAAMAEAPHASDENAALRALGRDLRQRLVGPRPH